MRTFYCQAASCGHHVDAWIEPPQRCPGCGRVADWSTEPPPFEARVTVQDRQELQKGGIVVDEDPE